MNNSDAQRSRVEKAIEAWTTAVNAGDVEGLINLVTDDFEMIPPAEEPVSGNVAHEYLRGFFQFDLSLSATTLELIVVDGLALRRYHYQLKLTPKEGGQSQLMSGQGIHVLRRESDGHWKFSKDMYNEDPTA